MAGLHLTRVVLLAVALLFSPIVLGLAAHMTSLTTLFDFYFYFAALGIATAVLTMLTLPIMYINSLLSAFIL
jgi:hypothetical protein